MTKSPSPSSDPVRAYLGGLSKPALVALVMDHADGPFRAHLELKAARCAPKGPDLPRLRNHLQEILDDMRGYDYREAADHARRLDGFAETLNGMIRDGNASAAMELAAEALEGVENRYGDVDDSGGYVGESACLLREVHRSACAAAGADPETLAQWLFRMEMHGEYGLFENLLEEYREALGERGVARYRKIAEEIWDCVPPIGPGEEVPADGNRWRIASIMMGLAGDDPEACLDVLVRDLSDPSRYLRIAEHCLKAGWPERALHWAEAGVQAFNDPGSRLRAFLAERYGGQGRIQEALALCWANFHEHPELGTYQALLAMARKAHSVPAQRDRALEFIREKYAKTKSRKNRWNRADLDLLVRIHLQEKEPQAALAAAREGGCRFETWMALAGSLEKDQPQDALVILDSQLETIIAPMGEDAYQQATDTLKRIHGLAARVGSPGLFATTLGRVVSAHGRKRNLMARIKKAGLV